MLKADVFKCKHTSGSIKHTGLHNSNNTIFCAMLHSKDIETIKYIKLFYGIDQQKDFVLFSYISEKMKAKL